MLLKQLGLNKSELQFPSYLFSFLPLHLLFCFFPSHLFNISPTSILYLSFSFYCTVFLLRILSCLLVDHYTFCHPFPYSLSFAHLLRSSSYPCPETTLIYSSFFSALPNFRGYPALLGSLTHFQPALGVGEGTPDTTPRYSPGTSRVSENPTQFWHRLPKERLRLHRVGGAVLQDCPLTSLQTRVTSLGYYWCF